MHVYVVWDIREQTCVVFVCVYVCVCVCVYVYICVYIDSFNWNRKYVSSHRMLSGTN